MFTPFLHGLGTGGSLIVAIGAQNAFVLSNGIKKNHNLTIALICFLCDTILICAGIAGVGAAVSAHPVIGVATLWGGVLFLWCYGCSSLLSALRGGQSTSPVQTPTSLRAAVSATLAITLLNPHVYLDTMVLMGSIGSQFSGIGQLLFASGAILASFVWFFSLSFGSRALAPLFSSELAWRILDCLVGATMITIGILLLVRDPI